MAVQVDKGPGPAVFQETVNGIAVHCRIKVIVFYGKRRYVFFQFMESDKETDGIVPPGVGKAQEERYIGFQLGVIAGEVERV